MNIDNNLNEFLHVFDKNPHKHSKELADRIIENPTAFFNMSIYLFDKLSEKDIARIIIERPQLVTWLKKYLYKLSDNTKKEIIEKRPELSNVLESYKKKFKHLKMFEDFNQKRNISE
jgi:hypothetical protein